MLSNRRWWLKFTIAIAGFVALCGHAAWSLPRTRAGLRECLARPDEFDGRTVWLDAREVTGNQPDGSFTTVGQGMTVRVKGDYVPGTGKHVSLRGTFRKPDLVVADPKGIKEYSYYKAQRGGVYTISGAVLLAWLWWFLKRFRPGLRGFQPRPDAPAEAPPPGAK